MRHLITIAALTLVACTPSADWRIDAEFTPAQRAEIVAAIEQWEQAIDVPQTWAVSSRDPNVNHYRPISCARGCACHFGSDIYLYPDPGIPCTLRLQSLMNHEMGHAFGLPHDHAVSSDGDCVPQAAVDYACALRQCGSRAAGTCEE